LLGASEYRAFSNFTCSIDKKEIIVSEIIKVKDFFISYNIVDKEIAEWIAWQLEAAGYTTVIQAWDFGLGQNFVLAMQKAATEAKRTIAVLSPDYLSSKFTAPEWAAAFVQDSTGVQRLLIPVRVRPVELTGLLSSIIYIDLVGTTKDEAKLRLLDGVSDGRKKPLTEPDFKNLF
jgi:hypothetical protein